MRSCLALLLLALIVACGSTTDEDARNDEVLSNVGASASPSVDPTPTPVTSVAPEPAEPTPEPVAPPGGWQLVVDEAPWGRRAGLRVVEFDDALYLLGGRTPRNSTLPGDSDIWSDVWRSDDLGATWSLVLDTGLEHWPGRAYFQAVVLDDRMLILGGQDYGLMDNPFCALLEQGLEPPDFLNIDPDAPCPEFLPTSQFFNDVWASADGQTWEQLTEAAPWTPRAGLSAAVLDGFVYVLGGSVNDDSALIGPNGPTREYRNDVWRSSDGANWELMTEAAPWEPRAGASVIEWQGALWVFGGEFGFTCTPVETCEPPYFNDVWRSTDGASWEQITDAAGWSPRPGHQCEALDDEVVCFGGFGLVDNPDDVWTTSDGVSWVELDDRSWNAAVATDVKYDFESIAVDTPDGPTVLTFGGDRETFDFSDPDNWLRVDADVWRFRLPG